MATWVCENCGAQYDTHDPPCLQCAGENFVNVEDVEQSQRVGETGTARWVCAECGEPHVKNSPPCTRCGHMSFEQADDTSQSSLSGGQESAQPSASVNRRDVLKYGGAIAVVVAGGAYLFVSRDDYPSTTAPGAAEEASGIRFETVETELRGVINDARDDAGTDTVSTASNVDAFATYYNKEIVKEGGDIDAVESEAFDGKFDVSDYYALANHYGRDYSGRAIDFFEDASELARDCADSWLSDSRFRESLTDGQYSAIGTDVHTDTAGDIYFLVVLS